MSPQSHGLLVEFAEPDALVEAVRRLREMGFTQFDTFSPYPVEGLEEQLMDHPSSLPGIMLGAGVIGAAGGFFLQWYAARDYPLNIGGRPLFSWPAFIPVTFELGILTAVLTGIAVFLWRAGLPRYDHPAFSVASFSRASSDRFFVWIRPDEPKYSVARVQELLMPLTIPSITEVPV